MTMATIRRLAAEDVPALSVLAKETFFSTFTGTCTDEDMAGFLIQYYNEQVLAEEIAAGCEYYFIELAGNPAGYLSVKDEMPSLPEIKDSSALELKRFYVKKEFHGSGAKIVNMGELFAYPRLVNVPMRRCIRIA